MILYATSDDLASWLSGDAPSNATQLLRSASLLITQATQAAYYAVDTNGLPSVPALLQAFNDAACAQAAVWIAAGVDPNTAGLQAIAPTRQKGIGTASIAYDTSLSASVTAFTVRQQLASRLCVESARILQAVGLIVTAPWIA